MEKVRHIRPASTRSVRNSKALLMSACNIVEALDGKLEGYVLMAWDGKGATTITTKDGGGVSHDLIPLHAFSQLTAMVNT